MGELTDKIKGTANEAIGKAKQQSDNPATKAEGETQETRGAFQNLKGDVKGALGDKV